MDRSRRPDATKDDVPGDSGPPGARSGGQATRRVRRDTKSTSTYSPSRSGEA